MVAGLPPLAPDTPLAAAPIADEDDDGVTSNELEAKFAESDREEEEVTPPSHVDAGSFPAQRPES
jgi:hypothetical protein